MVHSMCANAPISEPLQLKPKTKWRARHPPPLPLAQPQTTSTPSLPPGLKSTLDAVKVWHGNGPRLNHAVQIVGVHAAISAPLQLKPKTKWRASRTTARVVIAATARAKMYKTGPRSSVSATKDGTQDGALQCVVLLPIVSARVFLATMQQNVGVFRLLPAEHRHH